MEWPVWLGFGLHLPTSCPHAHLHLEGHWQEAHPLSLHPPKGTGSLVMDEGASARQTTTTPSPPAAPRPCYLPTPVPCRASLQ